MGAVTGAAAPSGPLLSPLWYRVAALKPRLRPHARLHRHHYRGALWFLLHDPASGRMHRFTPAARRVIALLDGARSVADVWEAANRQMGEAAPTQDEVIHLLGQLHAADLLQTDVSPDVAELFRRGEREERTRWRRSYANPMAIRIPVWDPDRLLDATAPLWRVVWSRWGALAWLLVVLPALLLVPPHWQDLAGNFSDRVLALDHLVAVTLVFLVLKLLHELGHATATKAGGGEVHETGVMLLVLLPVPYVDASAATAFRSKWERVLVGAAGMVVELLVAAIAFHLWLAAEPGAARAVLFDIMLTASVATLVFNGNPLLRYDAYYMLADLLEMPNLAARATRYWIYLFERHLVRLPHAETQEASATEKAWLLFYGVASTAYRLLVTVVIALFVASRFFFIGVALAILALGATVLVPLGKALSYLATSPRLRQHRLRALGAVGAMTAALAVLVVGVPIPSHTAAEGVTWIDDRATVRAGGNGFVQRLAVEPGSPVARGDALIEVEDPALVAQLRLTEARIAEFQALYAAGLRTGPAEAQIARERLAQERAALAALRERTTELAVRARADGEFVVPQGADLPGRYVRKGDVLGYVVERAAPLVRVVVPQEAVDRVRASAGRVRVRVVDRPAEVLVGRVVREVPGGDDLLPSRVLGTEGGGEISTDPRDGSGPRSLQRMFQFDIALEDGAPRDQFGIRALVRFEHEEEAMAAQVYRTLRLMFLSRFGV